MKLKLVRIGNSRGVRIPKAVIQQCGFGDTVEAHVEEDRLVAPERRARQGWKNAFAAAGSSARDASAFKTLPPSQFDAEGWTW